MVSPVFCVLVANRSERAPLLIRTWPVFADELAAVLEGAGEDHLTDLVDRLRIVKVCGCGDHFCQSFFTAAKPAGADHRCAERDSFAVVELAVPPRYTVATGVRVAG
jgi:hypothetical protein